MSSDLATTPISRRPKRADAARNYDLLIEAARDAFTEDGADASLEGVARRAGVGIGTLYRNFPTRQALLEAVYVEEVDAICRAAGDVDGEDPWKALTDWLRSFADYAKTKKALMGELVSYLDSDSTMFTQCRSSIEGVAIPLFEAAQRAGAVREDIDVMDVVRMVGGIANIPNADGEQIDRIMAVALDGLRPR